MGDDEPDILWPPDGPHRDLLEAAGRCLARWGVSKTTVADLATEAGCSRATVYRLFPGGKSQIMAAYGVFELQTFFDDAARRVEESSTLEDALVTLITSATRGLADHSGFQFMLTHEPGLILPYLGFANIDRLYRLSADALGPAFERFAPGRAARLVELVARITLSHTFQPSPSLDVREADDVRRLVRRHLLPILDVDTHPVSVAAFPTPAHTAVPA